MAAFGVTIWGTRGLIASPHRDKAIFGGNTPCVQVQHENQLIIVDSGFGIANLGEILLQRILTKQEALQVHIFYTHFHWDHIQGLPFFKPIYFESTELHLYSPESTETTLDNLNILFDGSYSPFESLLKMQAHVHLHQLKGPMNLHGLKIAYQAVDHGSIQSENSGSTANQSAHSTYAYRFTAESGQSICLITDHEARPSPQNTAVVNFAKRCDLLIHDAQFLPHEYPAHVGWGHSTTTQALDNALHIDAAKVLLTHHAPDRTDRELMHEHHRLMQVPCYIPLNFEFAREDVEYIAANRNNKSVRGS